MNFPACSGARPHNASANSDLPEPLGPSMAHCSPRRHVQLVRGNIVRPLSRTAILSRVSQVALVLAAADFTMLST